jgi:hypothetical protein
MPTPPITLVQTATGFSLPPGQTDFTGLLGDVFVGGADAYIDLIVNGPGVTPKVTTMPYVLKTGNYQIVDSDRGNYFLSADAGNDAWTIAAPTATTFLNGWYCFLKNGSTTGTITITPASGTIDGAASIVLPAHTNFLIECDGTNFHTSAHSPAGNNSANQVFASPNGTAGLASMRALVAADLPALTQSQIPNIASAFAYLPNVKVLPAYTSQTGLTGGTTVDVYTVPAGRRAFCLGSSISNEASATAASTFSTKVKVSGAYYQLWISSSVGAGAGITAPTSGIIPTYVAEAGESFSITQTTTGAVWTATVTVVEFDNTAALKTVKVINPVLGDNLLYTPSGTKNAITVTLGSVIGNPALNGQQSGFFYSSSAGAPTTNLNYLRGAAPASTSNRIATASSISAGSAVTAMFPFSFYVSIANGDSISVNLSVGITGFIAITVAEF